MNILCIDTSSNVCSVAIVTEEKVLAERILNTKLNHSQILMTMISDIFKDVEIEKEDIGAVVVSKGPGSFTGVRIGVTTANTFAKILNIPVIGVSSLEALAANIDATNKKVCTLLDAKGGKVYNCVYRVDSEVKPVHTEKVSKIDELIDELATGEEFILVGDGVNIYGEKIRTKLGENKVVYAKKQNNIHRASSLADLVNFESLKGNEYVIPSYLKKSQAEENLKN